jgi:hypothetical protein
MTHLSNFFYSRAVIFQDEFLPEYCIPPTQEATRPCPEARFVPLPPILSMEHTKESLRPPLILELLLTLHYKTIKLIFTKGSPQGPLSYLPSGIRRRPVK